MFRKFLTVTLITLLGLLPLAFSESDGDGGPMTEPNGFAADGGPMTEPNGL